MKNFIIAIIIIFIALKASSQSVSQNFNSGNRNAESANCWYTPGCSFVSTSTELIEGTYTLRTGQLTGGGSNPNGLISPWVKLDGNGTITFQHRLTTWNSGSSRKLYVSLESATNQNVQDTLYQFTYNSSNATTVRSETINIPAYTAGKVYRIRVFDFGTGGNSRGLIDNFSVKGTYWSRPSQDCEPISVVHDTDHDSVHDGEDDFPIDVNRSYTSVFPASGYGTLLFEDLWPANGDNDFNDLVLNYRITTITNAANKVVEVQYTLIAKAIGGYFRNGFSFQLDGIAPAKIRSISRSKGPGNFFTLASNGTEVSQTFANIPVFSNTQELLRSTGGGIGVNINPAAAFVTPDTTRITVTFLENGQPASGQTAINATAVSASLFNPYIIVNQERGKEIHCADKTPSSLASSIYFGSADDKSNAAINKYYKNKNNLPWALNIAGNIPYTKEGKDITTAYLKLAAWAISGGVSFPDWYINNNGYRSTTNLY